MNVALTLLGEGAATRLASWFAPRGSQVAVKAAGRLRVCFPAGTIVSTPTGPKSIESVREGDEVYAFDFDTGEVVVRKVKTTFHREAAELLQLYVGGELIEATRSHPFWVVGTGWVEAADLQVGMRLSGITGSMEVISHIGGRSEPVAVYNLEVDSEHNYFVSSKALLVHNQNLDTDFNRALNTALDWLKSKGVDTSKVVGAFEAKFGPHKGNPIGVRFEGGGYYRIEFDARNGVHINVGVGKTKGPHVVFEGTQKNSEQTNPSPI